MTKNFKKLLVMLALIITCTLGMSVSAHAEIYSGTTKDTVWSVNTETGVLTIKKDGEMGEWTYGSTPWYNYRSYIREIEFSGGVTRITSYAFADLINLKEINIPNSVERVDEQAFLNCASATSIDIPVSVVAWGGNVFDNCYSVELIRTSNEADIDVSAPIWTATVGSKSKDGISVKVESSNIGKAAFNGLNNVKELVLREMDMTTINSYAFYGITAPLELNLKNTKEIGEYAFYGCMGISAIDLPSAIKIGDYAFAGCSEVTTINVPVASYIGSGAFENCSSATKIYIGYPNPTFGAKNIFKGCSSCEELYLGGAGFANGSQALSGLGTKNGVTITLSKEITSIPNRAFALDDVGRMGNATLVLEEGSKLSNIGASAFKGNTSLVSVDLFNAKNDMTMGAEAFSGCTEVEMFKTGTGALTLGKESLANMTGCKEFYHECEVIRPVIEWDCNLLQTQITINTTYAPEAVAWTSSTYTTKNGRYYTGHRYCWPTGANLADATVNSSYTVDYEPKYKIPYTHSLMNLGADEGCSLTIGEGTRQIAKNLFHIGTRYKVTTVVEDGSLTTQAKNLEANCVFVNPQNNSTVYDQNMAIRVPALTIPIPSKNLSTYISVSSGIKITNVLGKSKGIMQIGETAFGLADRECSVSIKIDTAVPEATISLGNYRGKKHGGTQGSIDDNTPPVPSVENCSLAYGGNLTITASPATTSQTILAKGETLIPQLGVTDSIPENANALLFTTLGLLNEPGSEIKEGAFLYNTALEEIVIGSGISTIEKNAFHGISSNSIAQVLGKTGNTFEPATGNGLTPEGNTSVGSIVYYAEGHNGQGILVAEYDVGDTVKAHLYKTTADEYLINLVGAGATFDTFDAETTRPEWEEEYRTNITEVVVDDGVTSVGQYLFYNHPRLEKVDLGATVENIGAHSFENTKISALTIPASVLSIGDAAFAGSSLQTIKYNATAAAIGTVNPFAETAGGKISLTIGDSVTSIPAYAFCNSNIAKVYIGAGVTSIGEAAFSSKLLTDVTVSANNTTYKVDGRNEDLYTADGRTLVTYLGGHKDSMYTIPANVNTIGAGAFYGHHYLERLNFDADITSVGANACVNSNLQTIAVTGYMDSASFANDVELGENWSGTAEVVFSGLSWDIGVNKGDMTAILYSDGTLAIEGKGAMKSWPSANAVEWMAKRAAITKVTFTGDIASVGAYAFYGCENLHDIVLPETIDAIGQYAFYGCKNLNGMYIPDKVEVINTYTFANCTNMPWLDGGLGLTTVEPFAFANCTSTRYIVLNSSVSTIKANAFVGDKNLSLMVAGKTQDADFAQRDGVVKKDVFRICYMPDVKTAKSVTRYPANDETAAGRYDNAVATELWAYAFDTNQDGKADYFHIAGASGMENDWASKTDVPWDAIRNDITRVYVEDDVTSLGAYSFEDCKNLTHVRIGLLCQTIGTHTFYNCSSLEIMNIHTKLFNTGSLNEDSDVFVNAGSPKGFAVVFEDEVARIPGWLFDSCENLTNITFGKALDTINQYAFNNCTGLKTVYIKSDAIISNSDKVFTNAGHASGGFTVEIAANVTKIPSNIFYSEDGDPYVTGVFVANGSKLKEIGSSAFKGCSRLAEVHFANCSVLETIQSQAFDSCVRLITADFSNCQNLETIDSGAFKNCANMSEFSLQNDLKLYRIASEAFYNCNSMNEIVLSGSVMEVGSSAFGNWTGKQIIYVLDKASQSDFGSAASGWSGNATVIYTTFVWDMSVEGDGSVMAYYTVPVSNAEMPTEDYTIFVVGSGPMKDFAEQDAINWEGKNASTDIRSTVTRVVVNDGITRIGNYNFAGFDNCKKVELGNDIVEVGKASFKDGVLIPEIDLSGSAANLEFIEDSAFEGCHGLSTVNLSGCDKLEAVGQDSFKQMAGSSVIYVSSESLYNMLANTNGNIKSTYGTTANTRIVSVRAYFTENLTSQGVMNGNEVVWHVEAVSNDNLTFTWYYAPQRGGEWTEITSAMTGYTVESTPTASTLTMDPSIVTVDKNGYYFMVKASSPYYSEASNQAALAVYSSAITPTITVVDKNGDTLESNTWTQGPLTIYITAGTADNDITPTYQYKLKASGAWRNAEPIMTYNTEGIVTFYCRAIINGDTNTASPSVRYVLKVDNSGPTVNISADPEFESTESVDLTATANDNVSGVQSITWYKTAADANEGEQNTGVTGYVPLMQEVDMNTVELSVRHFRIQGNSYMADESSTIYIGKNQTHSFKSMVDVDTDEDMETAANSKRLQSAVTDGELEAFELYEVHVQNADGDDYAISASQKGIITLPIPSGYDKNRMVVYSFARAGIFTPVSDFTISEDGKEVTFSVSSFGQFAVATKPMPAADPGAETALVIE